MIITIRPQTNDEFVKSLQNGIAPCWAKSWGEDRNGVFVTVKAFTFRPNCNERWSCVVEDGRDLNPLKEAGISFNTSS